MSLVQFLFSFEGRVRRLHLWLFFLALGFIYGGLFWQFGHWHVAHDMMRDSSFEYNGVSFVTHNPLIGVLGLVAIWMKLAVLAKRWHDRDKSAWWLLIVLVPFIGLIWQFIECALVDGTQGPNKYGPSPKGIGAPERAF